MTSLLMVALLTTSTALTQSPPGPAPPPPTAISTDEASLVTGVWAALAEGDLGTAAARVAELQNAFPRSSHILPLIVEVNLFNGSMAALGVYEGMLGQASQLNEEPSVLRRIAHAVLNDAAAGQSQVARIKALRALADDGDPVAADKLLQAAQQGSLGDIVALASTGHPQAAARVAETLSQPMPNKIALVEALAEGGSTASIPAIVAMLDDPRPEHRAAAATALGRLGARDQVERLQAMLKEPNQPPSLPLAVAGALLRLNDASGIDRLRETLRSPVPAMRLAAAEALEPRADAAWTATVSDLRDADDPVVRLDAAKLLIRHDPAAARATIEQLARSDDPGVASLAAEMLASELSDDLTELRSLLRQPASQVDAAIHILELTR